MPVFVIQLHTKGCLLDNIVHVEIKIVYCLCFDLGGQAGPDKGSGWATVVCTMWMS